MSWKFRRIAPDEVETEITQRDQFRNDDVDLSDTIVRESIQNSLDAATGSEPVRVRFSFVDESDGINKRFFDGLFADQLAHARKAGIDVDAALQDSASALIIEDFGTTGLTGQTNRRDDSNFSDFWRRHGKSHKTGKSGGRWGLGKIVYSYSSRLGAFFGLTARDGDEQPYLMGQTVLNTHDIDGIHYAPHGFFADTKPDEPDQGLQIPIADPSLADSLARQCEMQRGLQSGLSVIIPYPRVELDARKMTAVGVENYFFPILTDELVLEFDETTVTRETLRAVSADFCHDRIADAKMVFDFVEAAHAMRQSHENGENGMLELDTEWYDDRKLSDDDFSPELLDELRNRFSEHELIGIRLRVAIKREDGRDEMSHFDLFLKTDPELSRGNDLYVRGGITVPGETKFKHRKALGALVAKDEAISEFLGDAENASHTKWNGRAEKLTAKYKRTNHTLSAVRNSLVQLHDVLAQAVEEEAEDALMDFFWAPGAEGKKSKRGRKSPPKPDVPPLPRTPRPVYVKPSEGGFEIRPTEDATADQFPLRCRAVVAYDVPSGNPFKKWEKFDFEIGKSKGIPIRGDNVRFEALSGNTLEMVFPEPNFFLRIEGFDPERDLVVRLTTSEAEA